MADRYINAEYVRRFLGSAVVEALTSDTTEDPADVLNTLIESATSAVQAAMRNSGYAVATDGVGDGVLQSDSLVRSATMGALWEILASRPASTVALPDNWKSHPLNQARVDIYEGKAQLPVAVSNSRDVVGGAAFSISTSDDPNGKPAAATRTNLAGW